jgi:TetR/AcrR family transcriptional regulator, mexJK operon transcriptional repressor
MKQNSDNGEARTSPGEKRRQAMIDAAFALFIEKGYASVTLDDIIKISGGSKSSVYKFFESKEGILKAVIESLADQMVENIALPVPPNGTVREALTRIGRSMGALALSENAIQQYRLAVSNAKNHPELALLWFNSGPNRVFEALAGFFRDATEAGRLKVENPTRAALFFLGMIICKDHMTMSIGAPPPPRAELDEIVREAVNVVLAAYGR